MVETGCDKLVVVVLPICTVAAVKTDGIVTLPLFMFRVENVSPEVMVCVPEPFRFTVPAPPVNVPVFDMLPVTFKTPPAVITKEPVPVVVIEAAVREPLTPKVRLPPVPMVILKPVFRTAELTVTAVEMVTVALFAGNVPLGQGALAVTLFQSPAPAEVCENRLDTVKNKNVKSNKPVLIISLDNLELECKRFIYLFVCKNLCLINIFIE